MARTEKQIQESYEHIEREYEKGLEKEKNKKAKRQRINASVSDAMYNQVKEKAEELGISSSGLVNVALAQYFQQDKAMSSLEILLNSLGNLGGEKDDKNVENTV